MKKKIIKYSLLIVVLLSVIWASMAITDYCRCRTLKEPIFVKPLIVTKNNEGIWQGIGYDVEILREAENDKNLITEMSFSLFGSGVIKTELIDGEIEILDYDWSAAFIHW